MNFQLECDCFIGFFCTVNVRCFQVKTIFYWVQEACVDNLCYYRCRQMHCRNHKFFFAILFFIDDFDITICTPLFFTFLEFPFLFHQMSKLSLFHFFKISNDFSPDIWYKGFELSVGIIKRLTWYLY